MNTVKPDASASDLPKQPGKVAAQEAGRFRFRHGTTPRSGFDVTKILEKAKTLTVNCPQCGYEYHLPVPVNLTNLICPECGEMDPVHWPADGKGSAPVNHRLMQRLIATCYRHPNFALAVIQNFRRDWDRAKTQEWGIDKPLLVVHAAHAAVQRGHRSQWSYVVAIVAFAISALITFTNYPASFFVSLVGVSVACLLASRNTINLVFWETFCRPFSYNPSQIPSENIKEVQRIVDYCDATNSDNITFFGGYEPFSLFGQKYSSWSLLVDRRKRAGGGFEDEPAHLDIQSTYSNIVSRLLSAAAFRPGEPMSEARGLPITRFRVDDVVMAHSQNVKQNDDRLIVEGIPQSHISESALRSFKVQPDSRYRVYKRVSYYDAQRDLGLLTFLRITHHGPFTYVESDGTRLLPMAKLLLGVYTDEPIAKEIVKEQEALEKWYGIPLKRRQYIQFTGGGLIFFLALSLTLFFPLNVWLTGLNANVADAPSAGMGGSHLAALVSLSVAWAAIIAKIKIAYGGPPKLEDDWEIKRPKLIEYVFSFGLVALLPYRPEIERQKRRLQVEAMKATGEWDYAAAFKAFRVHLGRAAVQTQFEGDDLLLLRRTQDLAVQEAFLQCLEEAGIDTTDFREGAALINNYGIINNSSQISGGASVETNISSDGSKQQKQTAQHGEAKLHRPRNTSAQP